jgi:hypothetical protein
VAMMDFDRRHRVSPSEDENDATQAVTSERENCSPVAKRNECIPHSRRGKEFVQL